MSSQELQNFLKSNPNVKFIRLQIIDFSGIVRAQILPCKRALEIAVKGSFKSTASPFTALVTAANGIVWDSLQLGSGDWEPDWKSLRVCCYHPTHASVMCFSRQYGEDPQEKYALCPRWQLKHQLDRANMKFLVGWEIELQMMDADKVTTIPKAINALGTSGYRNRFLPIMEEIALALEEVGVEVYKFHTEEPFEGFFELVLMPMSPMEAADTFVYCHEAIKGIAHHHGVLATMHPKPFEEGGPRIGSHAHFSISKTNVETNFLAGVLEASPAMAAMMNSNFDSFERFKGQTWVTWGKENKVAAVNQCGPGHWEFRRPDGTMNPYLVLAGLIMAGMHGVRDKRDVIEWPLDFPVKGDLTEEQREKYRITTKFPRTLDEALDEFEKYQLFASEDGFGEDFVKHYLRMKRIEVKDFSGMSFARRRVLYLQAF